MRAWSEKTKEFLDFYVDESYLLNFKVNEIMLETGNLAIWARADGLQTHMNGIDARRKELIGFLGFNRLCTIFRIFCIKYFLIHSD